MTDCVVVGDRQIRDRRHRGSETRHRDLPETTACHRGTSHDGMVSHSCSRVFVTCIEFHISGAFTDSLCMYYNDGKCEFKNR